MNSISPSETGTYDTYHYWRSKKLYHFSKNNHGFRAPGLDLHSKFESSRKQEHGWETKTWRVGFNPFEPCLFSCIRVIYFSSAYALPTFCLRRCSVRLRPALVSWSAYARLRLPLNFQFCLLGLHLVLVCCLRFVLSFHVLPTPVSLSTD